MLSSRYFKMAAFLAKIGYKIGASPLIFDAEHLKFYLPNNKKDFAKLKYTYIMLILWVAWGYLLIPKFRHDDNLERYNLTWFYALGATAIVMDCFSILRWNFEDIYRQLNGVIVFLNFLHATYMPHIDKDKIRLNWILEGMILFMSMCWAGLATFVSLLCLYDPTSLIFFGAWIPEKYYSFFPIGLLIWIHHTWFLFVVAVNGTLSFASMITYMFYVTVIFTNELRLGNNPKSYRTLKSLREKPENLRHIYRCFQILNANTMCFVGRFLAFTHALLIIIPVWCIFVLFRYWKVLSLLAKGPMILGFPLNMGFWLFILQLGKYLFVRSSKIMISWSRATWNNDLDRKIMKRFGKSCRPVVICWGKNLILGRMTQFNYIKGIMRGVFKVLVTLRG